VFALSLLAGGASNAAYSSDNSDTYDDLRCDDRDNEVCDDLGTIRSSEGAAAVSRNMMQLCSILSTLTLQTTYVINETLHTYVYSSTMYCCNSMCSLIPF